jgi:hypothetical protein
MNWDARGELLRLAKTLPVRAVSLLSFLPIYKKGWKLKKRLSYLTSKSNSKEGR